MNENQWKQVEALYFELQQLNEVERQHKLQEAAEHYPAIYEEVAQLLKEEEAVHPVLNTASTIIWEGNDDKSLVGTAIDHYRLVRHLGSGGMGSVFLADREDGEFEQQVALKLIKPGVLDEDALVRFKRERQILANLKHPHIARLYDGGRSKDDRLYFTMEFLEGNDLTTYCEKHQLGLQERLDLFLEVGSAITYAHQQLVLHLDIKPANIAVDKNGNVKVLDFGVAEIAMDAENPTKDDADALKKRFTLAFAAPEQLSEEPVSTASDIYSLGILLYHLLTGNIPFLPETKDLDDYKSLILTRLPQPPSQIVHTNHPVSATGVKGDLDAICLKALEKDPKDRYLSVDQMMDDIKDFKKIRPISLKADNQLYRFKKYLTRNRLAVGLTSILTIAIIGITAFYTFQLAEERKLAIEEADKTRQLLGFLTKSFQNANPQEALGDTMTVYELLADAKQQIEPQFHDQPDLLAAMAFELGAIYFNMDERPIADSLITKGYEIVKQQDPIDIKQLGKAYMLMAEVKSNLGTYDTAKVYAQKAVDLYEEEKVDKKDLVQAIYTRNSTFYGYTNIHGPTEKFEELDSLFNDYYDLVTTVYDPPHVEIAKCLFFQAAVNRKLRNYQLADSVYQVTLKMQSALFQEPSSEIAYTLNHLASLNRNIGDYEKAIAYAEQGYNQRMEIYGKYHSLTLASLTNFGRTYFDDADYEKAIPIFEETIERQAKLFKNGPDSEQLYPYYKLADSHNKLNNYPEAQRAAEKGLALADLIDTEKDDYFESRLHRALGLALFEQKRFPQAEPHFQHIIDNRPKQDGTQAIFQYRLAVCLWEQGKFEDAIQYFKTARSNFTPYKDRYQEYKDRIKSYLEQSNPILD